MTADNSRKSLILQSSLLILISVVIPVLGLYGLPFLPSFRELPLTNSGGSSYPSSRLSFVKNRIGAEPKFPAWLTHVQILDFDGDNLADVIACDARHHRVVLYQQSSTGTWLEKVLGENLVAPAHATIVDLDQDGDRDVVVAVLGNIWPDDGIVGRVVWLENTGTGFRQHVLLDDVRRVADVQAGDLDGDGDIDLAVAVFGYARGEILWLENRGEGRFRDHQLFVAPGTIHVPLADFDGDGDFDIVAVVSQDLEEVWGFENQGNGRFQPRRLLAFENFDLGSAGLVLCDLDQDGDQDLILPVGDNLEDIHSYPQPYHGCFWLENRGAWNFVKHRIAQFGGTYAAAIGDLDGDRDQDVVLVSMFNDWDRKGHASVIWLENDGQQNFKTWQIAEHPTHLVTVACGDLNGDGRDDVVAGSLHLVPPFTNIEGLSAWISSTGSRP